MSLHNRSSTCYLSVILRSLSIKVLSLVLDKHIGIQHVLASVLAACTRFVKYFCNIAILISKNVWKCFHATLHNLNRCSSLPLSCFSSANMQSQASFLELIYFLTKFKIRISFIVHIFQYQTTENLDIVRERKIWIEMVSKI